MSADISVLWTDRRRPAGGDVCPLQVKKRTEGQEVFTWDRKSEDRTPGGGVTREESVAMETSQSSEDELGRLDIDLDRKSRQHNLTMSNVRTILHEVITHEHVVAMMKAAIKDTQDLPLFEPKMTRSRVRQAVQQGQPLNWSLSAVNTVKPPQFVDIDLEEDEDSSDEEYCPDEEEEEEEDTAEETFLSDADSLASPLRARHSELRPTDPQDEDAGSIPSGDRCCSRSLLPQRSSGHLREQVTSSSSSSSAPADSSFLERLNAVEEELDSSPAYTFNQSLDREAAEDDDGDDEGCLAFRTRSKLRLVNVPLGQLEAELLAPDITADMYDLSVAQREEDRHWTKWLRGLMAPDNEEEAEDEDDPEYNFLDDMDEPDLEDYRTDRAVQITKREVNELLEELFDTLQEEEVAADEQEQEEEREEGEEREEEEEQEEEEEEREKEEHEEEKEEQEEEVLSQTAPKFNVPQALRFEAPLARMLTERRRTVRRRYEALQQRRALQDATNHHHDNATNHHHDNAACSQPDANTSLLLLPSRPSPALRLDSAQKLQLQQQIQQHVQLLTQVHLLSHRVHALNHEADLTKHYLEELQQFARRQEQLFLPSSFRVCNLQEALELLQEEEQREEPPPAPAAAPASRRLLPTMTPTTHSHAFPLLPAHTAWLFATRPVFLYPELLPVCSLDPALHLQNHRSVYTAGEDGLIVLGLHHFDGAVQSDQLISSYLLRKNRVNFRKHVREMSGSKAPPNNVIKMFQTQRVVPPLPPACSSVQPGDRRPPVDRDTPNTPSWLKNSQQIIRRSRRGSATYPPSLPPGCTLRLHPYWLNKSSRPPPPRHRRLFTLAHNASLQPLATKAPANVQPISFLSLAPPTAPGALPLAAVHPACADTIRQCPPIGRGTRQTVSRQQDAPLPLLLPLPSLSGSDITNGAVKPSCLLLQMTLTPPTAASQPITEAQAFTWPRPPEQEERPTLRQVMKEEEEEEEEEEEGEEEEDWTVVGVVSLNGGDSTGEGEKEEGRERRGAGGGGGEEAGGGGEEEGQREEGGGGGGGEREQGGEEEGQREEGGGGEREEDGEKEKDEDQDRQGEEEEEEDFDDLTQDEDEEEVMSSASEESVLSVPELQETMKQLTWLAAERRLCADGDSEEDHSPTSAGSQEEEEEEEEEGPKGEESGEGRGGKTGGDEETPLGEEPPRGGAGRCPGRGRGRPRPLRGRSQQRRSKDAAKLLLLLDDNILDNDPQRESKDVAFAQSYLNRVREALADTPAQVQQFVSLLSEFEQAGEGQDVLLLFRQLRCILGDRTDLLRDFAAFLRPGQALQCGLLEEQQAFERSRRFLRQLEISFGDNPSHYQKIIRALQSSCDLSTGSVTELKAQMATLLKGHTHLQAEFWVFFDELRPPPARPGQFEEAHWPEDGGGGSEGGDGVSQVSGGGATGGFEEVTLPELEEEEEGHKIQPMTCRRQRRKMNVHRNYKDCDWSDKDWPCSCRDEKIRRHRRKGCSRCHGNKTSGGVATAMKSLDPLYQISSAPGERGDSPQPDRSSASWEGSFPLTDEKEEEEELDEEEEDEEEEERRSLEKEQRPAVKRSRREEPPPAPPPSSAPPRPSPPPDPPVCAKNISLTASGEKVILWTREADRVILTTCQQEGANQSTFQSISTLLGNKTSSEVSRRFRDLMRLFRTSARQTSSEDEAPPTETAATNEEEDSHT